ncbi:N-acyl homoserine lactonase family protein [Nocardioides pacificus]
MSALPRLFPFRSGHIELPTAFFLGGEEGRTRAPISCFLIEHPDGLTIFDAGFGRRFSRPDGTPADGHIDLPDSELLDRQVAAAGFDPAEVSRVVCSHLHTDHAGGLDLFPQARIVVQREEWAHATTADDRAYHRPEFETGQDVETVDGEHDLYGDGTVVLVPTPGHTPGHQSARVRAATGVAVLAGDACNLTRAMDLLRIPDHAHSEADYRSSLQWFADERDAGHHVFPSHDPDFWAGVTPGAPWPDGRD